MFPKSRVPNIYHFVFGLKAQTEPFHLLHYLCLASCLAINKPDKVIVHLHNEPFGPLWDRIRPQIEVRQICDADLAVDLRYIDRFTEKFSYAHVADFVRLRVLLAEGGVYADMDTLFVSPTPAEFFAAPCVMGREKVDRAAAAPVAGSLCNAWIMAQPRSEFIRLWLERMPGAFDGGWSNHSTFLPYRIACEFPELIRVEPERRFFAFDWSAEGIASLYERDCALPEGAASLHLWAHLWWDFARRDMSGFSREQLTPAYVAHAQTTYARLARPFLPPDLIPPRGAYEAECERWKEALRCCGHFGPNGVFARTGHDRDRPRAVLITATTPDPNGVGLALRAYRWVAELAAQYALDILVVSNEPRPAPTHPLPARVAFLHRIGAPLNARPLEDWIAPDEPIRTTLVALSGPTPVRVVVFRAYLHDVAAHLPPEWRARAELDCDDWEAATRLSIAKLAVRHGRLRDAAQALRNGVRYAAIERRIFPTYKTVYLSAFEDVRRLRSLTGGRNFEALPNRIVADAALRPPPLAADSRTLLFVGALHYPPNDDAMRWFGKAILPRLRRLAPDVRVIAAGRAEGRLQRRLERDGIEYVHGPEDLAPIYAGAAAVIAPLRGGGGTKLKVLEAWRHGRPVVATSHAVRGLAARDGEHLLVANSPRAFAAACAQLLANAPLAAHLAANARALLDDRYTLAPPPNAGSIS